eukprot:538398_1
MKRRHKEYAIWGRLLRETVECFGLLVTRSDIPYFYHGVSNTLIFDSTTIQLCAPTSTTADSHIAATIFGANGIVIDIVKELNSMAYFDCRSWSDFHAEDEKLWIG